MSDDEFSNLSKTDRVNSEQASALIKGQVANCILFNSKEKQVKIIFENGQNIIVDNIDSILDISITKS